MKYWKLQFFAALFMIALLSAENNTSYGNIYVQKSPSYAGTVYGTAYNFLVPTTRWVGATAYSGYEFKNWVKNSGDCSINNPALPDTSVYVNSGNCVVTAMFNNSSGVGSLVVTASPSYGGMAYGTEYNFTVPANKSIMAVANAGYAFSFWSKSGNCTVSNIYSPNTTVHVASGTCYVTGYFNSTANNTSGTGSLIVTASPTYGGTVYGTEYNFTVPANKLIMAVAKAGYAFSKWVKTGNCMIGNQYANNTTVYVVSGTCNVVGYFTNKTSPPNTSIGSADVGGAEMQIQSIELPGKVIVNQRTYGKIVTSNAGIGRSIETKTAYYIDSQYVNSVLVPALSPGQTSSGEMTFICKRAGTYTLSVKADYENKINEKDEINNGKALKFTCISSANAASGPADAIVASMADVFGGVYSAIMSLCGVPPEAFAA